MTHPTLRNDANGDAAYSIRRRDALPPASRLVLLSGNSNLPLAFRIAETTGIPLGRATVTAFADGEANILIHEPMTAANVVIVQATDTPQAFIEVVLLVDAAKRSGAHRVTLVLPYMGYSRQDRRQGQEPLSAALMARLIESAGADCVIALDLHGHAAEGFFRIPVVHLPSTSAFVAAWRTAGLAGPALTIASPDPGGAKRAALACQALGSDDNLVVLHKRRTGDQLAILGLSGDVSGQTVMLVDDIIATGQTLVKAGEALLEHGARDVFASVTHVVRPQALPGLLAGPLSGLFVTDSLPLPGIAHPRLHVVPVAPLLADAIFRTHGA